MNDHMIVQSVTTLGAVVLGFVLGQVSEWIRYRSRTKAKRKAIRRIIELETRNNISHIQNFWNTILARKTSWTSEDGGFPHAQLAEEISRVPFPPLTTAAWAANLGDIASVYSQYELEAMWRHQRDLERLESYYIFFCEARHERQETNRFSQAMHGKSIMGTMIGGIGFLESVKEPAKEFKQLIESVMAFQGVDS